MVRLLIISVAFFFGTQAMAADCGVFKVVKGDVKFKKKSEGAYSKARKNKKVCQGYTVKTEADGRAKIQMADKNEINISPDTEMVIETYQAGQKAVLNVINGKVRSDVKNKYKDTKQSHYRVKTKSAVAGVRGTEFLASYDQSTNQSRIVTFEGEVAVGQLSGDTFKPKVTVKPGQYTSNSPGVDPHTPKEVPPAEFAQMDQETQVDDAGSSKQPASTNQGKKPEAEKEKNDKGTNGQNGRAPKGNGKGSGPNAPAPGADSPDAKAPGGDDSAGLFDGDQAEEQPPIAGEMPEGDDKFREDDQYGDPNFDPSLEDGSGGERDVASVDGGDGSMDSLLPPPDLNEGPKMDQIVDQPNLEIVNTDTLLDRPQVDPINNNIVQDGVINTSDVVNVNVIPCVAGTCPNGQ